MELALLDMVRGYLHAFHIAPQNTCKREQWRCVVGTGLEGMLGVLGVYKHTTVGHSSKRWAAPWRIAPHRTKPPEFSIRVGNNVGDIRHKRKDEWSLAQEEWRGRVGESAEWRWRPWWQSWQQCFKGEEGRAAGRWRGLARGRGSQEAQGRHGAARAPADAYTFFFLSHACACYMTATNATYCTERTHVQPLTFP